MKVYIIGASGWMGGRCVEYMRSRGHVVIADRVDVTDFPALCFAFQKNRPDVVINFAGVRAYPTIDWCEDHKEETISVNVGGAINVAVASVRAQAYMVQIASGCIYSGGTEKEFTEDDTPNFFGSFYSRMRVVMQDALKELPVLQVRIRMPLSMQSHPRNLITKIASYKKVISVPNSVTLVEDLFQALEIVIEKKPTGILNLVNKGFIKHEDILAAYKEIVDPSHTYELIPADELEKTITKAPRSNCVLSSNKAAQLGIVMPALTSDRLRKIMEAYRQSHVL